MARNSAEATIEQAAQTGLGFVRAQDLPGASDPDFGWQQAGVSGETPGGVDLGNRNGGRLEVALPRAGTPQGAGYALLRNSSDPQNVLVIARELWHEHVAAAKAGHYDMIS